MYICKNINQKLSRFKSRKDSIFNLHSAPSTILHFSRKRRAFRREGSNATTSIETVSVEIEIEIEGPIRLRQNEFRGYFTSQGVRFHRSFLELLVARAIVPQAADFLFCFVTSKLDECARFTLVHVSISSFLARSRTNRCKITQAEDQIKLSRNAENNAKFLFVICLL